MGNKTGVARRNLRTGAPAQAGQAAQLTRSEQLKAHGAPATERRAPKVRADRRHGDTIDRAAELAYESALAKRAGGRL